MVIMAEAGVVVGSVVATAVVFTLCLLGFWFFCIRKKGHFPIITRQLGQYEKPIKYELSHQVGIYAAWMGRVL